MTTCVRVVTADEDEMDRANHLFSFLTAHDVEIRKFPGKAILRAWSDDPRAEIDVRGEQMTVRSKSPGSFIFAKIA